nr:hypothetical protein GCM10020241_38340 [Streptoalloteichus tenebrarius]
MRRGVEHRRVAVGVGEGLGQRTGREVVQLREHAPGGVLVGLLERPGAQPLLDLEHLEEVELQVPQVALVVAHLVSSRVRAGRPAGHAPLLTGNNESITHR